VHPGDRACRNYHIYTAVISRIKTSIPGFFPLHIACGIVDTHGSHSRVTPYLLVVLFTNPLTTAMPAARLVAALTNCRNINTANCDK